MMKFSRYRLCIILTLKDLVATVGKNPCNGFMLEKADGQILAAGFVIISDCLLLVTAECV